MKLYSKEYLKDSRIFFEKQPANYLNYLGCFFIIFVCLSLFMLKYLPKNYIVRAQGSIEADDRLYITPSVNADIIEIHRKEGEQVVKGDIILTLSTGLEGVQDREIEKQLQEANQKEEVFDKYEKSLSEKKNALKNISGEQEYYGKVEYYLSQVREDEKQSNNSQKAIYKKNAEISELEKDLISIKDNAYSNFEKEVSRKNQDLNEKIKKKSELEKQMEIVNSSEEGQGETTSGTTENYSTELETITQEIKILQREIEDATISYENDLTEKTKAKNEELKNKRQELDDIKLQSNNQSFLTYQQLISELGVARNQNKVKLIELQGQQSIKNNESNLLKLTAGKDGRVHYLFPVIKGAGLQAFQPVAQIDNGKNSKLIVDCYISAQDRSKIKINDVAKVAISGVNQTKYGQLKGTVTSIGSGTVSQGTDNETQLLYHVKISLKETQLASADESINAEASMPIVANIVYDKETYLDWILEQLNLTKEN